MKRLTILFPIALTCLTLIVPFPAAATDLPEQFIQGSWRAQGTDPSGRHGWFQEWTFNKGKFKLSGYPPLEQEGSYRVFKSESNKLTLELYDQKGTFGTENSKLEIIIDEKKGTLVINGHTFERIKPSS